MKNTNEKSRRKKIFLPNEKIFDLNKEKIGIVFYEVILVFKVELFI
jgi:hypothetical protein